MIKKSYGSKTKHNFNLFSTEAIVSQCVLPICIPYGLLLRIHSSNTFPGEYNDHTY